MTASRKSFSGAQFMQNKNDKSSNHSIMQFCSKTLTPCDESERLTFTNFCVYRYLGSGSVRDSEILKHAHAHIDPYFPSTRLSKHTLYQIISVCDSNLWNVDGIKRFSRVARTKIWEKHFKEDFLWNLIENNLVQKTRMDKESLIVY